MPGFSLLEHGILPGPPVSEPWVFQGHVYHLNVGPFYSCCAEATLWTKESRRFWDIPQTSQSGSSDILCVPSLEP